MKKHQEQGNQTRATHTSKSCFMKGFLVVALAGDFTDRQVTPISILGGFRRPTAGSASGVHILKSQLLSALTRTL